MGVGSQDDFDEAVDFLDDTGIESFTMLWEQTGVAWAINQVRVNSSIQLFSYDLAHKSNVASFSEANSFAILNAATDPPWVP